MAFMLLQERGKAVVDFCEIFDFSLDIYQMKSVHSALKIICNSELGDLWAGMSYIYLDR